MAYERPSGAELTSLLDLDPELAPMLGAEGIESVGRRLLMAVVRVPAGASRPPIGGLPPGTFALGVLEGLLLREAGDRGRACLSGPGDLVEPWTAAPDLRWTALRPLRLAVLGPPLLAALQPLPEVLVRLLARALCQESRRAGGGGGRERPRADALEAMRETVTAAFARASAAHSAALEASAQIAQRGAPRRPLSPRGLRDAPAAPGRGRTPRARDAPARRDR